MAAQAITAGEDPLGEQLCRIRSVAARRAIGAFFTPTALVAPMLDWVLARRPDRVVDPGCGSGRFAAGVVRRRPDLEIVAVDVDPMATLLTRAALAVLGARHASVRLADYTAFTLPPIAGRTAFVGNPPYVRHHDLTPGMKSRAAALGKLLGYPVSGLAGLHAYFYLATALYARPGDVGCFITSAEWLDVGYGALIRNLLLNGLGGKALHVVDPQAVPFEDAMTTAAIACFEVGAQPDMMRFRLVEMTDDIQTLAAGDEVDTRALANAHRWRSFLHDRNTTRTAAGWIPLRQVARVHRGVVTGANGFFVLTRDHARELGLEEWCRPAITSADEILRSGGVVRNIPERRLLLEIPRDVDRRAHPQLDTYLRRAEISHDGKVPISERYIASRRRPWWHIGGPPAPPIVVSYMARQAPVFALNPDRLAVVNIAHGLYPTEEMSEQQLAALVTHLNDVRESFRGSGRTYHGGLEKFEPGELEALPIPADGPWN
ncbi:MAG: Eco57I restriction-modification methylase domain-containing protein [Chloroflexota bacterium]